MGRACILVLALAACGRDGPGRAAVLLSEGEGPLAEVQRAAGGWMGFSPGARVALGLRERLLGSLRPTSRPAGPPLVALWGGGGDDPFDLLQPELVDAGILLPGGGAARFPEIAIGGRPPVVGEIDLGGAAVSTTACSPALVGAYRGPALLVLDASGGFTLDDGGRQRRGRYRCAGRRLVLDAPAAHVELSIAADESLTGGDGRRYAPLGGPS